MSITQCFNKAANHYDLNCNLQFDVGKKLIKNLLNNVTSQKNIIDIGCGTGKITEELAKQISYQNFYAIDIAHQLLENATVRLASYPIQLHINDYDNIKNFNIAFDLIFSNMALHWSPNLKLTVESMAHSLIDNGLLAFTIPLKGTFQELNQDSVNTFISLEELTILLKNSHFEILSFNQEIIISHFNDARSALYSIKNIGGNYLFKKNTYGLRGKNFLKKIYNLEQHLNASYTLTYCIGYILAKKMDFTSCQQKSL